MTTARIPLAHSLSSRSASTAKDARIVNAFVETEGEKKYVVKRPGLASFTITPALGASTPQGMYTFKGTNKLYPVVNNTLYEVTSGGASTNIGAVAAGLYSFTETSGVPYLFLHNTTNAYNLTAAGAFTSVTAVGFPTNQTPALVLVPGAVYLDDTVYVMTTTGRIYNSAVEDTTTWNALDYVTKSSEPDGGVAIAKHLSYLVAFGQWSGEFFYDAANPVGSPLARDDTSKMEVGCANAQSVVQILTNQTVMWVGQSREGGRGVYWLLSKSPQKISTRAVDNFLNADAMINVRAWSVAIAGHVLYILTLKDSGYTLVYDLHEKLWYHWTSDNGAAVESYFTPEFYSSLNGLNFLQLPTGVLATFNDTTYQDLGVNINYRAVTPKLDNNDNKRKFWFSLELIGDMSNSSVSIRHTNDDYQTWSTYRAVSLANKRPIIYALGEGRRKAFDVWSTANTAIRLEAIEAEIQEGVS